MGPQIQTEPVSLDDAPRRWRPATRVLFRFGFLYFILFSLSNQIFGGFFPIPHLEIPDLSTLQPFRGVILWTAAHVFGVRKNLVYTGSGSGDKTFDWVLAFCIFLAAAAGCIVWSLLSRGRAARPKLYAWFRVFLRLALGSQLILYGMDKAIPLQMPFPYLTRLVQPYGSFSPMGVLWSFVGASTPYEIFVGCAEILGGVLLLIPRTATLGALVALADLIQVFTLNMTYDVPVKLFSFHLLVMSLVLLAPSLMSLRDFFLLNRPAAPAIEPRLFTSRRANGFAIAAQLTFCLLLLAGNAYGGWQSWHKYGGGREKSALYGIWNIRNLTVDGGPPVGAYADWRRLIFDFPSSMAVQFRNDRIGGYAATVLPNTNTVSVSSNGHSGFFRRQRPSAHELTLDGEMDGRRLHIELDLQDRDKFELTRRGFHWIQEYPYNR